MEEIFASLRDPWVLFGFLAQGIFMLRFVIQWIATEKAKQTTVPISFWYLSIIGATMIFVYALYRKDIVFMFGQAMAMVIYVRNVMVYQAHQKIKQAELSNAQAVNQKV